MCMTPSSGLCAGFPSLGPSSSTHSSPGLSRSSQVKTQTLSVRDPSPGGPHLSNDLATLPDTIPDTIPLNSGTLNFGLLPTMFFPILIPGKCCFSLYTRF